MSVRHLFFWGHRPQRDGSVGPGCLSQWWPAPFTVDGVRYATAEHSMMGGKALLFGDEAGGAAQPGRRRIAGQQDARGSALRVARRSARPRRTERRPVHLGKARLLEE